MLASWTLYTACLIKCQNDPLNFPPLPPLFPIAGPINWRGTKFTPGFEITCLCDFSQHNLSQIKQFDLGSIWCYFDLKVNLPTSRNSFSLFSFPTPSSLYWSLSSNVWPLFQYFLQISQAVTTTQPSLTQTTVMETVTMVTTREQILVKHAQEELPPPPPQKKRQIIVDSEIKKRWEALAHGFILKQG